MPEGRLLACGPAPVVAQAQGVAIAGTETELALAWLEEDGTDKQVLGFMRLAPGLASLSSTRVTLDTGQMRTWALSVAPLPSGWVVVGVTHILLRTFIYAHAFDASGRHVASTIVDDMLDDDFRALPVIAARSGAGPMLVWATEPAIRAAMISADGKSATEPFDVGLFDAEAGSLSAAYVADAFYVIHGEARAGDRHQLRLTRIETDGRVGSEIDALPGVDAHDAHLVSGANDLRVVYTGPLPFAPGNAEVSLQWRRLAATGAALTAPAVLPGSFGRTAAFGADTAVALFGAGSPPSLGLARVASDANPAAPFREIASGPSLDGLWGMDIARRGPDALIAWVPATGRVQLARVGN
jgi:hypothetical protein